MAEIGYTMMCEQRSPKDLVEDLVHAERAGFDFSVISDHSHSWLEEQGHSGYTWSILGAAANATERIPLMTYVTCPTFRYHPAVVAQKAATMGILSDGRFTLGLGAGENLNEHVVGGGWLPVDVRHEMLREAIEIIRKLFSGGYVTHHGDYFDVESAKLFDRPPDTVEIGVAVSGRSSCRIAGEQGDFVIATQPMPELMEMSREFGGEGKPGVAQIPVCWGPDETECRRLAREQFAWAMTGWKVQAELPNPINFAATETVTEDDIAGLIPCGPSVENITEGVKQFVDALKEL